MTRYVVDAPTLLHLVDRDYRIADGDQLVAPNAIRSQALQLLLDDVVAGRLEEKKALRRHERVTELKMRLLGDRVSRRTAWDIAREQGWDTLRLSEYLAVTRLQADAFVTVDRAAARLARGIVATEKVAVLLG